ncbi:hypothetical protein [Geobacillus sp. LEMMY01]|nr:hypothetical protein [Geobacillus sp. LEMMY01]
MKSAEDTAIKKVDFERERDEYMEWIRRGVNRPQSEGTGADSETVFE